jgi:hypothetical protein
LPPPNGSTAFREGVMLRLGGDADQSLRSRAAISLGRFSERLADREEGTHSRHSKITEAKTPRQAKVARSQTSRVRKV